MIDSYACISYCSFLYIYLSECCSSIYFEIYCKNSENNLMEIISRRNKSITAEIFSGLKFSQSVHVEDRGTQFSEIVVGATSDLCSIVGSLLLLLISSFDTM